MEKNDFLQKKKRGRPSSGRSNRLQLRASDSDLKKIDYLSHCFRSDSKTEVVMRAVDMAYHAFRQCPCHSCPNQFVCYETPCNDGHSCSDCSGLEDCRFITDGDSLI